MFPRPPKRHMEIVPEIYRTLYKTGDSGTGLTTTSTSHTLIKIGATTFTATASADAQNILFTLPSNWPQDMQFALECNIWSSGGGTAEAYLWDITAGVSTGIKVSTTSTTALVVRSTTRGTLIPGHSYGISFLTNGSAMNCNSITLVGFPVR